MRLFRGPGMREILRDEERMYILRENRDGELVLEALCGGVGMYNRVLTLSAEQRADYENWGKYYLDVLALKLCKGIL